MHRSYKNIHKPYHSTWRVPGAIDGLAPKVCPFEELGMIANNWDKLSYLAKDAWIAWYNTHVFNENSDQCVPESFITLTGG